MTGAFLAGVIAGYGVAVPVGAIAVLIAGLTARTSLRVGAAAGLGAATADGVYALIAVLGGAALAAAITPIATPLRWVAAGVLVLLAAHTARSALRGRKGAAADPAGSAVERAGPGVERAGSGVDPAGLDAGPGAGRAGSDADPGAGRAGSDADPGAGRVGLDAGLGVGRAGLDAGPGAGPGGSGVRPHGPVEPLGGEANIGSPDSRRDGAVADGTTAGRAYLGVLGLTLLNPATVVYFAALVLGRGGTGGGVWFVLGAFLASASWQLLIAGGGALVGRFLTGERGRRITALVSSVVIAILAIALIA